jgi:lysophospholipase L1-like esterase
MRSVMCFGDSNTHGTPPMVDLGAMARFGRDQRWTRHFARALGDGWEVIEEGHPGRTTLHDDPVEGAHRNGLTVLPALLESHRPLDVVVLMLGTNDLKARFAVTPMDIALSLERLVSVICGANAGPAGGAPGILLVAPPPIREVGCLAGLFEGGAVKSHRLGAEVAAAATRAGVPFVDAGAHIAVSDIDGIHYDADAHRILGLALADAMRHHFG